MTVRTPVNVDRTLAGTRTLASARGLTVRYAPTTSLSFTPNAIYQKASGTGPEGSGTMTAVTAFIVDGRPSVTEYMVSMGVATSSGGYGLRCLLSGPTNIAYDYFITNGVGSTITASSCLIDGTTQYNRLVVVHMTYNGTTLISYNNGVGLVPVAAVGYTIRNNAVPMAMGARGNLSDPLVLGGTLIGHQVYEANVATAGNITAHYAATVAALARGGRIPNIVSMTPTYAWSASDAGPTTWVDQVGGISLGLGTAGYVPEQTSTPAIP